MGGVGEARRDVGRCVGLRGEGKRKCEEGCGSTR